MSIAADVTDIRVTAYNPSNPTYHLEKHTAFITLLLRNAEQLVYQVTWDEYNDNEMLISPNLDHLLDLGTELRVAASKKARLTQKNEIEIYWLLNTLGDLIFNYITGKNWHVNFTAFFNNVDLIAMYANRSEELERLKQAIMDAPEHLHELIYLVEYTLCEPENGVEETVYYSVTTEYNPAYRPRFFSYLFSLINPTLGLAWQKTEEIVGYANPALNTHLISKAKLLNEEMTDTPPISKKVFYRYGFLNPELAVIDC